MATLACGCDHGGEDDNGEQAMTLSGTLEDSSSSGAATSTAAGATTAEDSGASDSGSSTGGDADACHGSDDCGAGSFCVAPYADNHRDPFACVDTCVGPDDEGQWCFDDAACCDAAAVCSIRGYCEAPSATSSDSSTGEPTTGSDSGSSTG
jgi:hypothetical protein